MKKKLALISALALSLMTSTGICAFAKEEIILPESYECYLQLENAFDVDVTNSYSAIADDQNIYVYDYTSSSYSMYAHTSPVSQVAFNASGELLFSDLKMSLYKLSPSSMTITAYPDVSCYQFSLDGDSLYYVSITRSNCTVFNSNGTSLYSTPSSCVISACGDYIYYSYERLIGTYSLKTGAKNEHPDENVTGNICDMVSDGTNLYFTDVSGKFYIYSISDEKVTYTFESGSKNFSKNGDKIYFVYPDCIKEYSLTDRAFTGKIIASSSTQEGRLSGAKDIVKLSDKTFIADTENSRIAILGEDTKYIKTDVKPNVMSVSSNEIFCADATDAEIYSHSGELKATLSLANPITDATCAFDSFYAVSEQGMTIIKGSEKQELSFSGAKLITSDIYNNIYLAFDDGIIKKYSSSSLSTEGENAQGELLDVRLPENAIDLECDFDCRIYALADNKITRLSDNNIIDIDEHCMLFGKPRANAFALSYDSNDVYVLFDGAVISIDSLELPNVTKIKTEGFARNDELKIACVNDGATLIEVEYSIKDNETFPYLNHSNTTKLDECIVLGETEIYYLIGNQEKTFLVLKSQTVLQSTADIVEDKEDYSAFLLRTFNLYTLPFIHDELILCPIEGGTALGVLSGLTIDGINFAYVKVGEKNGYIPISMLLENDIFSSEEVEMNFKTMTLSTQDELIFVSVTDAEKSITFSGKTNVEVYSHKSSGEKAYVIIQKDGEKYAALVDNTLLSEIDAYNFLWTVILTVISIGAIIIAVCYLIVRKKEE